MRKVIIATGVTYVFSIYVYDLDYITFGFQMIPNFLSIIIYA